MKKITKLQGFLISFYECPYCKEAFSEDDIKIHVKMCKRTYKKGKNAYEKKKK